MTAIDSSAEFVPEWLGNWGPPGGFDPEAGVFVSDSSTVASFPLEGLDVFGDVDDESFWFAHRAKIILGLIDEICPTPGAVLEVGSGSGTVAAAIAAAGRNVMAVEPNAGGAATARRRGVSAAFDGTLQEARLPDDTFDVVGFFDVIEHLDEWEDVLAEAHRVIRPSGHLVVTVPAYQWLWSEHDDWNEHKRRYTTASLTADLATLGFTVDRSSYFFAPFVAPAMVRRLSYVAGRRSDGDHEAKLRAQLQPNPTVNAVISRVLDVERRILDRTRLPFGTSVYALATPHEKSGS